MRNIGYRFLFIGFGGMGRNVWKFLYFCGWRWLGCCIKVTSDFNIRRVMKIIDEELLNEVSAQAKESPRLRMNYNFHQSLDEKCHRFLNAVEPGTVVPIHRHPTKDESFVILRGKVRVTTHDDDGSIIEDVVLGRESGGYGVDIPKGVWHKLESLELGSVIFECKAGPFVAHEVEGILDIGRL